jgi:hypothetical protein
MWGGAHENARNLILPYFMTIVQSTDGSPFGLTSCRLLSLV